MALATGMMLNVTGCGDKMIDLTKEERDQIIQFSAHIIGEFNKNQTEGYIALNKKQLDKIKHPEKYEHKTPEPQQPANEPGASASPENGGQSTPQQSQGKTITLSELVNTSGITATYKGYKVCKDYVESTVFSMAANEGNRFVVASIELSNTSGEEVSVDLLSKNLSLYLNVGDEKIRASTTLLANDFTTFEGKIKKDKKKKTVVIFEVSKKVADSLEKLELQSENDGSMCTIIIN